MPSVRSIRRRVRATFTTPLSSGGSFLAMTALVAYGDLVTKWLAVTLWRSESAHLAGGRISIDVVLNTLGAFGTSFGRLTWEINVAATIAAVLLATVVCPVLARLDSLAPAALGLVAGGGVGNLTSLVGWAAVPDFIALGDGRGGGLTLNFADVAAYIGLACCGRLLYHVVREIAGQRARRRIRG